MSDTMSGRFSLLGAPTALPGNCAGCGKATDPKGFIDTGFDADFHGVIYFCSECVFDMASKYGYILPEIAEKLTSQIIELEKELLIQRQAILGLEKTIDGLMEYRSAVSSNPDDSGTSDTESNPEPETDSEESNGNSVVEESESQSSDGDSTDYKPLAEQGSDGVSSDNSLESWADLGIEL